MSFPFHNLGALGLLYDGFGILVLGVPSVLLGYSQIMDNSLSRIGWSKPLLCYMLETKFDICIGSTMLSIGFIFQYLSSINQNISIWLLYLSWLALPVIPLVYIFLRKRIVKSRAIILISMVEKGNGKSEEDIAATIKRVFAE